MRDQGIFCWRASRFLDCLCTDFNVEPLSRSMLIGPMEHPVKTTASAIRSKYLKRVFLPRASSELLLLYSGVFFSWPGIWPPHQHTGTFGYRSSSTNSSRLRDPLSLWYNGMAYLDETWSFTCAHANLRGSLWLVCHGLKSHWHFRNHRPEKIIKYSAVCNHSNSPYASYQPTVTVECTPAAQVL